MHVVNRYDDELGRTSGELRSIQAERRLSAQPGRPMGRGEDRCATLSVHTSTRSSISLRISASRVGRLALLS